MGLGGPLPGSAVSSWVRIQSRCPIVWMSALACTRLRVCSQRLPSQAPIGKAQEALGRIREDRVIVRFQIRARRRRRGLREPGIERKRVAVEARPEAARRRS